MILEDFVDEQGKNAMWDWLSTQPADVQAFFIAKFYWCVHKPKGMRTNAGRNTPQRKERPLATEKLETLLEKMKEDKAFRSEFVATHAKFSLPNQIADLMVQQDLTQNELAQRSELSQGTVSRAVDINYGNLALNTIVRLAAGFDVAFVGRFVPFSEFFADLNSSQSDVKTFDEEVDKFTTVDDLLDSVSTIETPKVYNAGGRQGDWTPRGRVPEAHHGNHAPPNSFHAILSECLDA